MSDATLTRLIRPCIIPPVQRKSASFLCLQSACRIGPWVLTCCVDLCSAPDFPGVRVDDAALKPREHAVPESTTGQNAFLKACREFLICDEKTMRRINRGMSKLEAMRNADFKRYGDSGEFRQFWCGESKPTEDRFNSTNHHHGTGSLSVSQEYLALEDGPPIFRQDTTCPALLIELTACAFLCTGLSPCIARLSRRFH